MTLRTEKLPRSPDHAAERSDKERKIVDAAAKLFMRFGLKKTTIEDIARDAECGKGTIYLYFQSKEEIFAAAARGFCDHLTTRIEAAVFRESTPVAQLERYFIERWHAKRELLSRFEVCAELLIEMHTMPELKSLHDELGARRLAIAEKIIAGGIASGEFSPGNPQMAAKAITAAADTIGTPWDVTGADMPVEIKANILVDLFVNGLKAPAHAH